MLRETPQVVGESHKAGPRPYTPQACVLVKEKTQRVQSSGL